MMSNYLTPAIVHLITVYVWQLKWIEIERQLAVLWQDLDYFMASLIIYHQTFELG